MGRRATSTRTAGLLLAALLVAGCAADPGGEPADPASSAAPAARSTDGTERGGLSAHTGQSSTDASLGRMQVYVDNRTAAEVDPVSVTYVDPRLGGRSAGDRLRAIPAGSSRGYLVALPDRPACRVPRGRTGRVVVRTATDRVVVPVTDEYGIVTRHLDQRCDRLAVERVARLSWRPPEVTGRGTTATADLALEITPRGDAGHRLVLERLNGTPVLAPVDGDVWRPGTSVAGDDAPVLVRLPVRPRRCDPHAFAESGGATALRTRVRLDGEPRDLVLRMPVPVAAAVLDHALAVCGLGDD